MHHFHMREAKFLLLEPILLAGIQPTDFCPLPLMLQPGVLGHQYQLKTLLPTPNVSIHNPFYPILHLVIKVRCPTVHYQLKLTCFTGQIILGVMDRYAHQASSAFSVDSVNYFGPSEGVSGGTSIVYTVKQSTALNTL